MVIEHGNIVPQEEVQPPPFGSLPKVVMLEQGRWARWPPEFPPSPDHSVILQTHTQWKQVICECTLTLMFWFSELVRILHIKSRRQWEVKAEGEGGEEAEEGKGKKKRDRGAGKGKPSSCSKVSLRKICLCHWKLEHRRDFGFPVLILKKCNFSIVVDWQEVFRSTHLYLFLNMFLYIDMYIHVFIVYKCTYSFAYINTLKENPYCFLKMVVEIKTPSFKKKRKILIS